MVVLEFEYLVSHSFHVKRIKPIRCDRQERCAVKDNGDCRLGKEIETTLP